MSLVNAMTKTGKMFFELVNDRMMEYALTTLHNSITYSLRVDKKVDLGLMKLEIVKQGEGKASALIPSITLNDEFIKYVEDDDITFDEITLDHIYDIVSKAVTKSTFKKSYIEIARGKIYDIDKNKLVEGNANSARVVNTNEDELIATVVVFFATILEDLNENKGEESYTINTDIADFIVKVTGKNTKVSAAPSKTLKQLIKDDEAK